MQAPVGIAPSILAADFLRLGQQLEQIRTADYVHFDVMDGVFVPNLSFGPYVAAGADIVTFHYEAQLHAHRTISAIHEGGAKAGIALNPGTPASVLESLIEDLDLVLVMSVNPGFGGQAFIERTYDKLRAVRALAEAHGADPIVEVDGGVGAANAGKIVAAGANLLVAGSSVFKAADPAAAIAELRAAAGCDA